MIWTSSRQPARLFGSSQTGDTGTEDDELAHTIGNRRSHRLVRVEERRRRTADRQSSGAAEPWDNVITDPALPGFCSLLR